MVDREALHKEGYAYLRAMREREQQERREREWHAKLAVFRDVSRTIVRCRPDLGLPLGSEEERQAHRCSHECDPMNEAQCLRAGYLPRGYRPRDLAVHVCRRRAVHWCTPEWCTDRPVCRITGYEYAGQMNFAGLDGYEVRSQSYAARRGAEQRAVLGEDAGEEDGGGGGGEDDLDAGSAYEALVGAEEEIAERELLVEKRAREQEDGPGEDSAGEGVDGKGAVMEGDGLLFVEAEEEAVDDVDDEYASDVRAEETVVVVVEPVGGAAPDDGEGEVAVAQPTTMRGAFHKLPTARRAPPPVKRARTRCAGSIAAASATASWSDVEAAIVAPATHAPKQLMGPPTVNSFRLAAGAPADSALYVREPRPKRVIRQGGLSTAVAPVAVGSAQSSPTQSSPTPRPAPPRTTPAQPAYRKHRMSIANATLASGIQSVLRRLFFTHDVRKEINEARIAQRNESIVTAYREQLRRSLRARQWPNAIVAMCQAKASVPGLRLYAMLGWATADGATYAERLRRVWRVADSVGWVRSASRSLSVESFVLAMCNLMTSGWRQDGEDGIVIRSDPFIKRHMPRSDDLVRFGFSRLVCDGEKIVKNMLTWIHLRGANGALMDALAAAAPKQADAPEAVGRVGGGGGGGGGGNPH